MKSYWLGNTLILESLPNPQNAYMLIRLNIENDVATGSWHETTAPNGEFKGAQYSGSGQLVVNPQTFAMEGKWAGAGFDQKLQRIRVYAGNWEITPVG